MHPNYKIRTDWHDFELRIHLKLKDISEKIKEPYEWTVDCSCVKCQSEKNANVKGKGKGKKSGNID